MSKTYLATKDDLDKVQATIDETIDLSMDASDSINVLKNDIEKLSDNAEELYDQTISSYSVVGYETMNELMTCYINGTGVIGKFKASASITDIYQFNINDSLVYSVKRGEYDYIDIIENSWYTFVLDEDDKTINFKPVCGLPISEVSLATATTEDVHTEKTFYSGDKMLKKGSIYALTSQKVNPSLNMVSQANRTYTIKVTFDNLTTIYGYEISMMNIGLYDTPIISSNEITLYLVTLVATTTHALNITAYGI